MVRFVMMSLIRFFTFAPLTPDTHASGDFDVAPADIHDALGVDLGFSAPAQHLFVARAFTLIDEARSDPPHQRVKPEHGFREHVDGCGHVVAASDVTQLVRQHGCKLPRRQIVFDARRHQQYRTPETHDTGLHHTRSRSHVDARGHGQTVERPRASSRARPLESAATCRNRTTVIAMVPATQTPRMARANQSKPRGCFRNRQERRGPGPSTNGRLTWASVAETAGVAICGALDAHSSRSPSAISR